MGIPIIGDIIDAVKGVVSEVVVDKDKRDQVNLQLKEIEDRAEARYHEEVIAQQEVNKVEAANGSVFVAGWRPFVGWVGGVGLAYSTLVQPLASWVARVCGYLGSFPAIDNQLLLYVLGGMLGLGGMRTIEKIKGVSTNDLTDIPGRTQNTNTEVNVGANGSVNVTKEATPAGAAPVTTKRFKL